MLNTRKIQAAVVAILAAALLTLPAFAQDQMGKPDKMGKMDKMDKMDKMGKGAHKSSDFQGPKANKGYVTHSKENGKSVLTLSEDFVVPDTPDPHWRLVDSNGTIFDLDRLKVKGDRINTKITVPAYVKDVKKVIIWCAFAEANLGEAEFTKAVK